jgi:hypothetical protein
VSDKKGMMIASKCLRILIVVLISSITSFAQSYTIRGILKDTNVNVTLYNASVILLQARDSFIVTDTRADKDGRFAFNNLSDTVGYFLFISYPGYAAYAHKITANESRNGLSDMGTVSLLLKEKLLKEVIVKSQTAVIKIKGDTTEYVADSFKVQPNASVEELLRQLPGLQVDQYGNITAQGQTVKKVLVDGEEFFGDDPTLVTRNLRADMIDKVQVFDKKSDAAVFTGIDDGVKDKTINLKIKEDKNHGIFGKVEVGAGTNDHYNGHGMLNAFKGKRKMALYGTAGNIGRTGLGAADRQKLGLNNEGPDNYDGKGIPEITNIGAHYDNRWNGDKQSVNGNYKYNSMNVIGEENLVSQNNLPTGLIISEAFTLFNNNSNRHSANGKYIIKTDTTATFTVYADGVITDNETSRQGNMHNFRGDSSKIYDNQSQDYNEYHLRSYNINLSWEKRLRKAGHTISFYFNNNFANDNSSGENSSNSTYYDANGELDSTALLHLGKRTTDDWRTNTLKTLYTAPLSKKLALILNYEIANDLTHDDKRSFNLIDNPGGKNIDEAFSSKMNSETWSNQGGAALNYVAPKIVLKAGTNIRTVAMDIESQFENYRLKRQFLNWNPNASIQYTLAQYKMLYLSYNGSSTNPERTQLLPLKFNNGQLQDYIANTSLGNSFTHKLNAAFNSAKIMSNVYSGIRADLTLIADPIVQALDVTSSGKYVYQYRNMQGYVNSNYHVNAYYAKKFTAVDLHVEVSANTTGGATSSLINNAVNKLHYNTYGIGTGLYRSKLKRYSAYLQLQGGYTINKSSLQPESRNNYFFAEIKPSADIYFLKKFQLHTDAAYLWQQKSRAFSDDFSRTIWNAWVGRSLFKDDQLIIKLSCNDMLNQNTGYSRTADNSFFSENRYTTIRRFFMIGAAWNFTTFKTIKQ